MAVGMLQELDITLDQYDQVNATMGVADNPVEGLLVHTAGEKEGGGVRIFDVWESREAIDRFTEDRLMPAVQQVMGEGGGPPPREPAIYELHNVIQA